MGCLRAYATINPSVPDGVNNAPHVRRRNESRKLPRERVSFYHVVTWNPDRPNAIIPSILSASGLCLRPRGNPNFSMRHDAMAVARTLEDFCMDELLNLERRYYAGIHVYVAEKLFSRGNTTCRNISATIFISLHCSLLFDRCAAMMESSSVPLYVGDKALSNLRVFEYLNFPLILSAYTCTLEARLKIGNLYIHLDSFHRSWINDLFTRLLGKHG